MDYLERIKGLREDRDITQSEIAKYLNVAQNTYSQYESGKRELPVGVLPPLAQKSTPLLKKSSIYAAFQPSKPCSQPINKRNTKI